MTEEEYNKRVGFLDSLLRSESSSDKKETERELEWLRENKEDLLSGRKRY